MRNAIDLACRFTAVLALCALTGCIWTPRASPELDSAMKEFPAYAYGATIYVYRSSFSRPDEESILYMDGRVVGYTRPGTYFRIDTVPSRHVLHGIGLDSGQLAIDARAGEIYFVRLDIIGGQSKYRFESNQTARDQIRACCVMLENWPGSALSFLH